MTNYRIYTKVTKIGEDYYEATYREYDENGTLKAGGTEDFTGKRLRTATKKYIVKAYNGRANRAGGKMTDTIGTIRISNNAVAINVAKSKYDNVARVERVG